MARGGRGQDRARRLLEELLVAALNRTVTDTEGPRASVVTDDELHLDVPRSADAFFNEQAASAEHLAHLDSGCGNGPEELFGPHDLANPASTAACRRLDHQRIAHPIGDAQDRLVVVAIFDLRPFGDRNAHRFGESLAAYLVAQQGHRSRIGAEERDAGLLESGDKLRVFGDKPPTGPNGVASGLPDRRDHLVVAHVRADHRPIGGFLQGRPQVDHAVGELGKRRTDVRVGDDGDTPNVRATFEIVVPQGAAKTHGRFTSIEHSDGLNTGAAHGVDGVGQGRGSRCVSHGCLLGCLGSVGIARQVGRRCRLKAGSTGV